MVDVVNTPAAPTLREVSTVPAMMDFTETDSNASQTQVCRSRHYPSDQKLYSFVLKHCQKYQHSLWKPVSTKLRKLHFSSFRCALNSRCEFGVSHYTLSFDVLQNIYAKSTVVIFRNVN